MTRPRRARVHCTGCGNEIPMSWQEAMGFDVEWLLCSDCTPKASKPKVTLYGAPDGQDMGLWSDAPYVPQEPEEILGIVVREDVSPW